MKQISSQFIISDLSKPDILYKWESQRSDDWELLLSVGMGGRFHNASSFMQENQDCS